MRQSDYRAGPVQRTADQGGELGVMAHTFVVRGGGEASGELAAIREEVLNGWTYVHDAGDGTHHPAEGDR
jgi:hypothetical protein